ncbi:unnamed protein product, partial [Iphiclides podalirius]
MWYEKSGGFNKWFARAGVADRSSEVLAAGTLARQCPELTFPPHQLRLCARWASLYSLHCYTHACVRVPGVRTYLRKAVCYGCVGVRA